MRKFKSNYGKMRKRKRTENSFKSAHTRGQEAPPRKPKPQIKGTRKLCLLNTDHRLNQHLANTSTDIKFCNIEGTGRINSVTVTHRSG